MIFQPSAHICLCGPVLGADVTSRSGESGDFGSVFHRDNVRASLSLSRSSRCNRSSLVDLVRLKTYGRVGHAIGLSHAIRLGLRPFLD